MIDINSTQSGESSPRSPGPDLRRLAQLVALDDHGTVAAAASSLGLTSQALSRSLQELQRNSGLELLERDGRSLVLTEVGRFLVEGARPIFEASAALFDGAQRLGAGDLRPFVVGRTPAVGGSEAFDALSAIRAAMADRAITVREMFPDELIEALHSGDVDLGLRRGVSIQPDLGSQVIAFHSLRIAVPADHRLAASNEVTLSDLSAEPFVVWAPPGASFYTDFLIGACRGAGFEPSLVVNHIQGTPPVTAVLATGALAFVTDPPGMWCGGDVVVVALSDPPSVPLQALWLPHTHSPERDALLAAASTVRTRP